MKVAQIYTGLSLGRSRSIAGFSLGEKSLRGVFSRSRHSSCVSGNYSSCDGLKTPRAVSLLPLEKTVNSGYSGRYYSGNSVRF